MSYRYVNLNPGLRKEWDTDCNNCDDDTSISAAYCDIGATLPHLCATNLYGLTGVSVIGNLKPYWRTHRPPLRNIEILAK